MLIIVKILSSGDYIFFNLLILWFINIVYGKECDDYGRVHFPKQCGGCGICLRTEYDGVYGKLQCVYNMSQFGLSQYFDEKKTSQCEVANLCDSANATSECKGLPCVPFFAAFKCNCDKNKIGRTCQYNLAPGLSNKDYAVVENVLYAPKFDFSDYLPISILFSSLGRNNLEVVVETLLEKNVYDINKLEKIHFTSEYCKSIYRNYPKICTYGKFSHTKVKWILNIRLFYPGRDFQRELLFTGNNTIDLEDLSFIGQLELIKIFVFSNKDPNPVYDETFKVADFLMSPAFSACEPIVTIRQGADTVYKIVTYAKRSTIVVANFYKIPVVYNNRKPVVCFENINDFTIRWEAWKHSLNYDELTSPSFQSKLNTPYLYFKAFSLEKGTYKVRTNISVFEKGLEGFSVAYSYFKVILLDLEALIHGGDKKKVYYKTNYLRLNGSDSKNPNLNHLEKTEDLTFKWTCDKPVTAIISPSQIDRMKYITYIGHFEINTLYTFTLTITSKNYGITKSTSQKIFMTSDDVPSLGIFCKKNCGFSGYLSNPEESTYLYVNVSSYDETEKIVQSKINYTWTYSFDEGKSYQSVENIRQFNTGSNILIVRRDQLISGKNYVFRVEGGENAQGQAEFLINMAKPPPTNNFSCTVFPDDSKGVFQGYFDYDVRCDRLLIDGLSPRYEFYDRYPNEEGMGRLITSGNSHVAKYVGYTRGKLFVEVTDQWGMIIYTYERTRKTLWYKRPSTIVQELLDFLDIFYTTIDPEYRANAYSMIADIINKSKSIYFPNAVEIFKSLLEKASKEGFYSYVTMKLWASSLEIFASSAYAHGLDYMEVSYISEIITQLSTKFLNSVTESYDVYREFTDKEILVVSQMIMNSCNIVYLSRNPDLEDGKVKKEDVYEEYQKYRSSSLKIISSINDISDVFSQRTLPYLSSTQVQTGNISIWIKEDVPSSFAQSNNQNNPTQNDTYSTVKLSEELADYLQDSSEVVTLKVIEYNGNPFWWDNELKVITNVVCVELRKNKNEEPYEKLNKPIRIYLNFLKSRDTIIEGSVQQPDPKGTVIEADKMVDVYRMRVEERSTLKIKFHNLSDGETLKVKMLRNLRPDYEYTESGTIISKSNSEFHQVLQRPKSVYYYDYDYLGILPGSEVPVGNRQDYRMSVAIVNCASFEPVHGWNGDTCLGSDIMPETNQLMCECQRLIPGSQFAGFTSSPVKALNTFQDFDLFLKVRDNPFIAAFILLLLLLFLPLLFSACRHRYRDKGQIVYLEDNIPHDKFPYLVVVFTGSRLLTGTTSNVGIIIEGENTISRSHILRSSKYQTLQRGDDNWFLMYTPYHLGRIHMIQLWMDYSGNRPEWYLYKIIIIDVLNKIQYRFLINEWLSLRFGNYIQRFEKVDDDEEMKKDFFDENLAFGFREAHLWCSAFATHPRSALSKSERLTIAFCGVFVVMLVGCIFYGVIDETLEEPSEFRITFREIFVGIIGCFVVAFFIGFLVSIFRLALKTKSSHRPVIRQKKKRHRSELFKCCHAFHTFFIRKKRYMPVHCGADLVKSQKHVKTYKNPKLKYLAWYLLISTILVCALFTIMIAIKFEKVRFCQWVLSIILSLLQDIFLVSPLRILLFTIVSAMLYTAIYEVLTYDIDWKRVKQYKKHLFLRDPYIGVKLATARSNKIYVPLSYKEMMIKQEKQEWRDAVWLLLDILLVALLAILLIIQSGTLWTTKYYWHNHDVKALTKRAFKTEGFQQDAIKNVTSYLPFLRTKMFPLLYQMQWYNGQPLREQDSILNSMAYTLDGKACIFGLNRIRQLRLRPGLCKKPLTDNLTLICPNKIMEETEDIDIYAAGWVSVGNPESFVVSSVWDYKNTSETYDTELYGYTGLEYGAGGYLSDFGSSHSEAVDVVNSLQTQMWLDRRTVGILYELTIYNPNAGTLTWLLTITERLHIGLLINKIYVYTCDEQYNIRVIDIIVFLCICLFILRLILVLNRRGLPRLLSGFWNIWEIIIIILTFYCAFLYLKNYNTVKVYFKEFNEKQSKQKLYFEFLHIIEILSDIKIVFIVLFVMVMCRLLKCWNFGRSFDVLFQTLRSPWRYITWVLILICILIFIYWRLIIFKLNHFPYSHIIFLLLNNLDFLYTVNSCPSISCKFPDYMCCMVGKILMWMIAVHYLWTLRDKKNKQSNEPANLNLVTTLFPEKKPEEKSGLLFHKKQPEDKPFDPSSVRRKYIKRVRRIPVIREVE